MLGVSLRFKSLLCFALVVSGCGFFDEESPIKDVDSSMLLRERSCQFELPYDVQSTLQLQCFEFPFLPKRPDGSQGKRQRLPITVLKPIGRAELLEPLLYLSGGPGDAPRVDESRIYHWLGWYEAARLERPLVLVDLPNTGLSKPFFRCSSYDTYSAQVVSKFVEQEQEIAQAQDLLASCFSTLKRRGFSPYDHSTRANAQLLGQVMEALNYEQYAIYGVSYGTRLALELAVQKRDRITSLVLDSPYPHGFGLYENQLKLYSRNIKRLIKQGVNKDKLKLIVDYINTETVVIQKAGGHQEVALTTARFSSWLFWMGLQSERASVLKALVNAGSDGLQMGHERYSLWQKFLGIFIDQALDTDFSTLVYFAAECSDNPRPDPQVALSVLSELEVDVMPAEIRRALLAELAKPICPILEVYWSDLHRRPLKRDDISAIQIPVWVFSGAMDGVTPTAWADSLADTLKNSSVLIQDAKAGHGVLSHNQCLHQHLELILSAPDSRLTESVALQCLSEQRN